MSRSLSLIKDQKGKFYDKCFKYNGSKKLISYFCDSVCVFCFAGQTDPEAQLRQEVKELRAMLQANIQAQKIFIARTSGAATSATPPSCSAYKTRVNQVWCRI